MTRVRNNGGVTEEGGYLLDNAGSQARGRFAGLEACFDRLTEGHLAARGIRPGWRCLEIGAGTGSVARWLAREVGPDGSVLATDIDTRWTDDHGLATLEITTHDIAVDPLPGKAFDLIHGRLVVHHLPGRDAIVGRLAEALRPGGWLVLEDFDTILPHGLDPVSEEERAFVRVGSALSEALRRHGADTTWARTLPRRLRDAGLTEVGASGHVAIYHGGSPESALMRANLDQVGAAIIDAGLITAGELANALRLLRDPAFISNYPLMITAWGRKP